MADVQQVGGTHYDDDAARCPHCDGKIEHWDLLGHAPGLIYAATKYLARFGRKPGEGELEGLRKAMSYIEKQIRVIEAKIVRDEQTLQNASRKVTRRRRNISKVK